MTTQSSSLTTKDVWYPTTFSCLHWLIAWISFWNTTRPNQLDKYRTVLEKLSSASVHRNAQSALNLKAKQKTSVFSVLALSGVQLQALNANWQLRQVSWMQLWHSKALILVKLWSWLQYSKALILASWFSTVLGFLIPVTRLCEHTECKSQYSSLTWGWNWNSCWTWSWPTCFWATNKNDLW